MARRPTRAQRQRIAALIEKHAPLITDAFLRAVDDITASASVDNIIRSLEAGNIQGAVQALGIESAAYNQVTSAVESAYGDGGSAQTPRISAASGPNGGAIVRFDARNPVAETWLKNHSSTLITRIVEDQMQSIRQVLAAAMEAGDNPRTVALDIVGRINRATGRREGGIVGLTTQQAQYVRNARQELETGGSVALRNYLSRERRDKRFDRTVLKALRDGTPIPADVIQRATRNYSNQLLRLRGETIGRTEAMASLHAAQSEAYRQAIAKGQIREEQVRRVWNSAMDGRVRDSHAALHGETVGLHEPFTAPSGAQLMHPGDPNAPAEEIINCRCTLEIRIDYLSNLAPASGGRQVPGPAAPVPPAAGTSDPARKSKVRAVRPTGLPTTYKNIEIDGFAVYTKRGDLLPSSERQAFAAVFDSLPPGARAHASKRMFVLQEGTLERGVSPNAAGVYYSGKGAKGAVYVPTIAEGRVGASFGSRAAATDMTAAWQKTLTHEIGHSIDDFSGNANRISGWRTLPDGSREAIRSYWSQTNKAFTKAYENFAASRQSHPARQRFNYYLKTPHETFAEAFATLYAPNHPFRDVAEEFFGKEILDLVRKRVESIK